jgi:hypothetical protein
MASRGEITVFDLMASRAEGTVFDFDSPARRNNY